MPVSPPPVRPTPPRPPPPPPRPPPPPPSASSPAWKTPGNRSNNIGDGDGDVDSKGKVKVKGVRLNQIGHGDSSSTSTSTSTPLRNQQQHNNNFKNNLLHSPKSSSNSNINSNSRISINTVRIESSPLKAAATLIQTLDIAHTEMTSFAADAAADAENARRNARTAQEIARRYQNRSYPTFKMDALEASASNAGMNTLSITGTGTGRSTTTTSSSFIITPRPKHPEILGFDDMNIKRSHNGEEKDFENEEKQRNDDDDDNDNDTSMISKHRGKQNKLSNSISSRGGFHSPTSTSTSLERIAQHHADDVLQLTLDLERTKQALKSEQRLRKNCQSSLSSLQSKTVNLEKINQKLMEECGTERQQSTTQISDLEQELKLSGLRLQAAEEDAQLALDLAKDSAEQRDQMEDSLLEAQKEIEMLKQQQQQQQQNAQLQLAIVETPKRHVHFANANANATAVQHEEKSLTVIDTPREVGPPRSMVAAGRQLLLRRSMSPQDAVIRLELTPAKSAERRQQLYQRVNEHLNESTTNDDTNIMLLSSSPSRTPLSPARSSSNTAITSGDASAGATTIINQATKKKLEEYYTAIKILQISGKRLDLDGYWWREHSKTMPSHNPIQIDIMTRQYCQNVEVRTVQLRQAIIYNIYIYIYKTFKRVYYIC